MDELKLANAISKAIADLCPPAPTPIKTAGMFASIIDDDPPSTGGVIDLRAILADRLIHETRERMSSRFPQPAWGDE